MPRTGPMGRVFVVHLAEDGTRQILEVHGADVSVVTRSAWDSFLDARRLGGVPVERTIDLHGYVGEWQVFTGDVPEPEPAAQPAIESARPSLAERAAEAWDGRERH